MVALTVGSLFSGIGGIDLGLERAGMEVAWQCESNPYCRAVLRKHWPNVPCYEDVRDVNEQTPKVDVLAGGFPCQPVSVAGKGLAQADPRWLWPEFARCIRVVRPRFVLVENVPGLLRRGFGDVLCDLAGGGYDAEWDRIPASAFGAPHLRRRLFLIAYPKRGELRDEPGRGSGPSGKGTTVVSNDGPYRDVANGNGQRFTDIIGGGGPLSAGLAIACSGDAQPRAPYWSVEPDVDRVAHGVPSRVDRLRALGNAVVPQVAEYVGRQIVEMSAKW